MFGSQLVFGPGCVITFCRNRDSPKVSTDCVQSLSGYFVAYTAEMRVLQENLASHQQGVWEDKEMLVCPDAPPGRLQF